MTLFFRDHDIIFNVLLFHSYSLKRYLKKIVDKSAELDMERMQMVIHRRVLDSLNHLEDNPHDTVAFICIGDFLYGDSKNDVREYLHFFFN